MKHILASVFNVRVWRDPYLQEDFISITNRLVLIEDKYSEMHFDIKPLKKLPPYKLTYDRAFSLKALLDILESIKW